MRAFLFFASTLVAGVVGKTATSVSFSDTAVPGAGDVQLFTTMNTQSTATVTYNDGTTATTKFVYKPWFKTGDLVPNGLGGFTVAGGYYDATMAPIVDTTVAVPAPVIAGVTWPYAQLTASASPRQFFSDCPDGMSLITLAGASVPGVTGNPVFGVVQFEYTTYAQDGTTSMYGKLPAPYGILTLNQDTSSGDLSLVKYAPLDTSAAYGVWIPCAGSLSPWSTHLSSEEYEPDAVAVAACFVGGVLSTTTACTGLLYSNFVGNFKLSVTGQHPTWGTYPSPYLYGHIPEITMKTDGTATIKKNFCLGRISHELVHVMPDQKTVVMGDDATNAGFFVFIADKAGDLSAGTLYVAKLTTPLTTLDPTAAAVPIRWIKLGQTTSATVEGWAKTTVPTDMFLRSATDPLDATYTKIWLGGKTEWIKVIAGQELKMAFLETHRYAAYVGASMGFTKMEGTTINIKDKVFYSALQNCVESMVTGDAANNPSYQVQLAAANNAGAVMQLALGTAGTDTLGAAISSDWMPTNLKALIKGTDITANSWGDTADPANVANPDNLKFSETMRTLFIGEDCSQHVTCMGWAYNVDTKVLRRTLTAPVAAELTGLGAYDNINGFSYITSNFQHAGEYKSIHTKAKNIGSVHLARIFGDNAATLVGQGYGGYSAYVGYLKGYSSSTSLAKEMQLTVPDTTAAPTFSPNLQGTTTNNVGTSSCFAATETVTLEDGASKAIADVVVGDRILSADAAGKVVFSDVVYVPHAANSVAARFVALTTAAGHSVKMTVDHILPAGACGLPTLPLVRADQVAVGSCVRTVAGEEQVVSVSSYAGRGVYTVVTNEPYIVVNGIIATPVGGVNPALAQWYYNLHRLVYAFAPKAVLASQGWLQGAMESVGALLM